MQKINIKTSAPVELLEVTDKIQQLVDESRVKEGVCYLFVPHTTAGITLNEHADPSVVEDMAAVLEKLVPHSGSYRHGEGNSPAHVKASLFGSSQTVFIENGKLMLGTWQGVFFGEFDGPRNRTLFVKIIPG